MPNIIKEINKEITKIANIANSEDGNQTYKAIAMYLLSLWRKKKSLDKIRGLSKTLNISVSSISKFLTIGNIVNYQVLKYFYQINSEKITKKSMANSHLMQISKLIGNSNKILLVATGNTSLIAKVFYTNLILNGFNAIILDGSIDQVKMSNKMTQEDIIIIFSFSMRHTWMKEIYKKSKCQTVLFTSNQTLESSEGKSVVRIDSEKLINSTKENFYQTISLQTHLDTILKVLQKKSATF